MRIVDYTPEIRHLVMRSLEAVDRILPRFEDQQPRASEALHDAAPDLLALLAELYQLRRFARLGAPHIDDLGGFGTGLDDSDAPTIMSTVEGKETWDFQPWLAEKLRTAEQLVFRTIDVCTKASDPAGQWPAWRRVITTADPVTECHRLLEGVQAYLSAMLGIIDSGELAVRQLTADDDEDDLE